MTPAMIDALRLWGPIVLGALIGLCAGVILGRPLNALLGWSFRAFNRAFDLTTTAYTRTVSGLLWVSIVVLLIYGGLLG